MSDKKTWHVIDDLRYQSPQPHSWAYRRRIVRQASIIHLKTMGYKIQRYFLTGVTCMSIASRTERDRTLTL